MGRQRDLDPQARAGIEAVEQTLVVRRARAALRERARQAQAAAAHEGQPRILVAGQTHRRIAAGADGVERDRPLRPAPPPASRPPVLGQDGAQRRCEARAHVERRENRMPAVGALHVEGQLLVAGDLERARTVRPVLQPDPPDLDGIRGIDLDLGLGAHPAEAVHDPQRRRRGLRHLVIGARALTRPRAERPDRIAGGEPRIRVSQVEELAAQRERILGPAREVDLAAAVDPAHDPAVSDSLARELERVGAVAEPEALAASRRRSNATRRRRARAPPSLRQQHQRQRERRAPRGDRVAGQHGRHRRRRRGARAARQLRSVPGLVPFDAARDVERDQQRSPGREAADPLRNHPRARRVSDEARGALVEQIAADEREVDQRRDAQAHVIEPHQHAQPVVGEQAEEDLQAPAPEVAGLEQQRVQRRDHAAHRAVLVVPGGIRRKPEEAVDDRRHPESPALHPQRLLADSHQAARREQAAQRRRAALQRARSAGPG